MPSKLMMIFVGMDLVFAMCGGLLLGFSLTSEKIMRESPTKDNVAQNLLLGQCPLTAGVVNSIFILVTFLLSLPAFFLPQNKSWLRAQGWLVVFCATFTLTLGLTVWVDTLQTRQNLSKIWGRESPIVRSTLQQKFNCCGYFNSTTPPFIVDSTCPNALVAAQKGGCISQFSSFANAYLDLIFTACFGIVGVDVLLVLCVAMVLKWRSEQERYRAIDQKNGFGKL
ncbi:tetraspanin [Delitschia confertaspora ATCC 74209]|uniref:Tetraspanin n=1 Tax=Delitschia confertaspora ATCC 74209 TaxID=1513339 RepID=A0A9P4JGU0_9PLEO|nr:tetraspanin [Delitschia confertaspora ATCC 74209]